VINRPVKVSTEFGGRSVKLYHYLRGFQQPMRLRDTQPGGAKDVTCPQERSQ
jgi:hypothetical protein